MGRTTTHTYSVRQGNSYSFLHLLFDLFMTCITGGLWLIYILIRFLRTH